MKITVLNDADAKGGGYSEGRVGPNSLRAIKRA